MISSMIESDIIKAFAEAGYQINMEALMAIMNKGNISDSINKILKCVGDDVIVIEKDHVSRAMIQTSEEDFERELPLNDAISHPYDPYTPIRAENDGEALEAPDIDVLSDITNQSTCIGEYEEFVQYFRDRYTRLSEIIRKRIPSRPIESLKREQRGDDRDRISIIGMVREIRTTARGHRLIELEDPTGSIPALVLNGEEELFQLSEEILHDEVIGLTGRPGPNGGLFITEEITWPEIPNPSYSLKNMEKKRSPGNRVVFISDLHVGSKTFLEDAWHRFTAWLRGEKREREDPSPENIRYLIVAGDLVDGIGVYPGQENELLIDDIYRQYQKAAEYLKEIPPRIKIIISPGNHDAVRQAEPQPRFPAKITELFEKNTTFTGNPAMIGIEGVKILIYHGRAIDDLVAHIPSVEYQDPTVAMKEMLKRRHLAPIYGGRVSIAPERHDHFVIEEIPDILHCGHVHRAATSNYRGITLINSGTWQSQTEFQRRVNLQPTPGIATIMDLNTRETEMINFL